MDQRAAFNDFRSAIKIITLPQSKSSIHEDNLLLNSRYKAQFENIPLIGQSVNVITHAIRESVVQGQSDD